MLKLENLDITLFLIYTLRSQRSLRLAVLDQVVILVAACRAGLSTPCAMLYALCAQLSLRQ
jgi:hypothetical protein